MVSWMHRRREAAGPIGAEPEAQSGVDADSEARRGGREVKNLAKSRAERGNWARAALAAAQQTSKRLGLGSAIRTAPEPDVPTVEEEAPSPPSVSVPEQTRSNELVRAISAAAGPDHYRLLLVTGGTARRPEVLNEVGIYASDASTAIRQAFHIAWPPEAIGVILLDHQGREVFGRDNADRTQRGRRHGG